MDFIYYENKLLRLVIEEFDYKSVGRVFLFYFFVNSFVILVVKWFWCLVMVSFVLVGIFVLFLVKVLVL